jgi:hypothetical protein
MEKVEGQIHLSVSRKQGLSKSSMLIQKSKKNNFINKKIPERDIN